jgi:heptosyltransferase-2
VPRPRDRHDVERNLALLGPFGGAFGAPALRVAVDPAAALRAAALCPGGDGPLIGLAPGSVWRTKRWTTAGFAGVARALVAGGARCVLLGAPSDAAIADAIVERAGVALTNLVGRTDVPTLVGCIDRLDVLIGNDSAPIHIAAARDVPVVAIFCATTPALGYGPWGGRSTVVEADLACRPCGRHGGRRCPRGTDDCRHLVRAASVVAAVQRALEGAA